MSRLHKNVVFRRGTRLLYGRCSGEFADTVCISVTNFDTRVANQYGIDDFIVSGYTTILERDVIHSYDRQDMASLVGLLRGLEVIFGDYERKLKAVEDQFRASVKNYVDLYNKEVE